MEKPRKIGKSKDGREMHFSAGVIVESDGRYLLLDRLNPPPGFACPGGHVDEGEEPKTSAMRELWEETGIIVHDLEFVCEEEISWNYCKSATVHYWYLYKLLVEDDQINLNINEARSIGWYTLKEIKKMKMEKVWLYWFKKLKIL